MPKPVKFSYEKKTAFRDAFFFIVVCEGKNREPDYFRFFEGMSSRVKVVPVESGEGSSPMQLVTVAINKEKELDIKSEVDRVWFVIDTDRWREQLHSIRDESDQRLHWRVAQSNPCFEVWLYFHAKANPPELDDITQCNRWKPHLPTIIQGGFNADFHPVAIETATVNAKAAYTREGYFPNPGSTAVWMLAEELLPLIAKDLEGRKAICPAPIVVG